MTPSIAATAAMKSALAAKPWISAREKVRVKLHDEEGELYVLAESVPRK